MLEYEAARRHAQIVMRDMGIDESSKGVVTPGILCMSKGGGGRLHERECRAGQEGGDSLFRDGAAPGNYLGQDRMDMQFAAKEISSFTSKPDVQDWSSAKRLARHREDNRRVAIVYKYTVWSDMDYARCRRTRRST